MKQRIISIAAALALCLSLWTGTAWAEDTGITIGSSTTNTTWTADNTPGLTEGSIAYETDGSSYTLTLNGVQYSNSINIDLSSYNRNLTIVITGANSVNKISLGMVGTVILQGESDSSLTGDFDSRKDLQLSGFSGTLTSIVCNTSSNKITIYGDAKISSPEEIQNVVITENASLTIESGRKLTVTAVGSLSIAENASLTIASGGELNLHYTAALMSSVTGSTVNNGILSLNLADSSAPADVTTYVSKLGLNATASTGRVQTTDSSGNITGIYENSGAKKTVSPSGDLNLSDQISASDPENELLYGYKWEPTLDKDSNITSGTLTLKEGFDATTVTLPGNGANVTVKTEGNSHIMTLAYEGDTASTSIHLTFEGSKLTIDEQINFAGGNDSSITVAEGAEVEAKGGIYVSQSGGVDGSVIVNGTLTATSEYTAINTGKVKIGSKGYLKVIGENGVKVNGNPSEDPDTFKGAFVIEGGGTFDANCSKYNINVSAESAAGFPEGIDLKTVICLPESYLPEGYTLEKADGEPDEDGKISNHAISITNDPQGLRFDESGNLLGAISGQFLLHENHIWSKIWSIDKNEHWYACTFTGCDKKKDEAAHSFDSSGVCTKCGAKLEVTLTGDTGLVYDGTAKKPTVTAVTITDTENTPITLKDTDYTVSYADNINAGTGTVTVTSTGTPAWTATKNFSIAQAQLTISTVTAADKTYDGSNNASVNVTFSGLITGDTLTPGTDYTVNGTFEDANAGENKQVTGTVTLSSSSSTAKNYALSNGSFSATGKIKKAAVSGATPQNLNIANHLASTYTFLLSNLRPTISPGEWGTVTYTIAVEFTKDGYYNGDAKIIAGPSGALNTLSLPILSNGVDTAGQVGTVTVTVKSTNYEDFTNYIHIIAGGSKKRVSFGGVEGVTAVYNGQPSAGYTGTLTITDSDGNPVELTPEIRYTGRLSTSWDNAYTPPANVGTYSVVFRIPDDNPYYVGRWNVPFEITPAAVTITADDKRADVGSAMPDLTYTVSGLVGGDALAAEPTLACDADMSKAGSYPITASGAAVPSANYNPAITYVPGTLTVEESYVPPAHTHDWSTEWTADDACHWHECLADGCGITADSEKDGYGGHIPGEWTIDYPASSATAWLCYRTCTVCGRVLETESIPAGDDSYSGGGESSVRTYTITVEKSEHGKVNANRTSAASGTKVTLTVTPDTGYILLNLAVRDSQGNSISVTDRNTFTMPASAVTVKASFAPLPDDTVKPCDGGADCPSRGFTDLGTVGIWYHEAVDYVLRNDLMGGYGHGMFGPNDTLTRAQFAQILYNKEGRPAVMGGSIFTDVAPGAWCAPAITWAAERGITGGYGSGMFGPNDSITREQLAVMLWRYAGSPAPTDKELHFNDADKASGYALDALRWAVENGIISGKGGGILDPRGLADRAQTAQMLKNFFDK